MNYALYTKLPPQPLRDSSPNLGGATSLFEYLMPHRFD